MSPSLPPLWRVLFLAACLAVLPVRTALALSVSTVTRPDTDSLIVTFGPAGLFPTIARTGAREVTLTFPPGSLAAEKSPEGLDFGSSRLVDNLRLTGDKVVVRLRTDAFGYVGWPEGEHALKLQVYRDPAGANWTPGGGPDASPLAGPPRDGGPALTLPVTPPNNKPGPLELPPLPPALAAPDAGKAPAAPAAAKEPYYAVPYTLRAEALRVPPEKSPTLRPAGMEARAPVHDPAVPASGGGSLPVTPAPGELRVKLPPIPPAVAAAGETRGSVHPPAAPGAPQPAATPPPVTPPAPQASAAAPVAPPLAEADGHDKAPAEAEHKPAPESEKALDTNVLVAAQAEKLGGNYFGAKNMLESLKLKKDLDKDLREEVLHSLAALYADMFKDDPAAHYDEIQGAFQEAINYNTNSYRVPEALLQLGLLNLRVGNLPEAKGYFNVLTKKYPTDANVPLVNFYWGEYYFDHGDYKKAITEYQNLIEKFPESKFVREGAMGLAKSLVKVGRYKEAAQIADYIDKRWPRYYIDYPQILRIDGDIAYRNGDIKKARDDYMMFYNIEPKVKDADLVLARLGDIYAKLGNRAASVDFYNLAVKDYPDAEGGLIAKMRLAEQGVHDQPSIGEMFSLFDKPAAGSPEDIYNGIIRDHPDSPLAPLAQIKLAMWLLYRQNYPGSLKAAARFLERYPHSDLAPRATEVAVKAFEKMASDRLPRQDYARLVESWRDNPVLAANRDKLSDQTRLGLALAFMRTGAHREALAEALPYIGPKENANGLMALMMALTMYQNDRDWQGVVDLARKVQGWRFGASQRRTVEYMVAEALENLGDTARSRQLWKMLAGDQDLESGKRCFAMYYMAKDAMARKEFEKAQLYAGEATAMFRETGQAPDKLKGALNILVESTRELGQYPQSLKWAEQYALMCREGDDDWAANQLRIAAIQNAMGDTDGWRKTLTAMRDAAPDSLYGKMAASDLAANGLQNRINALSQSP